MNTMSIKDVCERYSLSPVYVRRMILQGKLKTTKVEIAKNTFKHMIDEQDVIDWRNQSHHNRRVDGRGRYVLHGTLEEIEKLRSLLENNDLSEVEISRQNKIKSVKIG